jgi:hypothetical protein
MRRSQKEESYWDSTRAQDPKGVRPVCVAQPNGIWAFFASRKCAMHGNAAEATEFQSLGGKYPWEGSHATRNNVAKNATLCCKNDITK